MPRTTTHPAIYRKVTSIDSVIPPALRALLKPYARMVGARRASDYVRFCVLVTTELLQAVQCGAKIYIVEADSSLEVYPLGSCELGNDLAQARDIFNSFEV